MTVDLTHRVDIPEFLDASEHDPQALRASLRHLVSINRWLGGRRVVLRYMATWVPKGGSARVLDVGAGAGDIPAALLAWARRRGRTLRVSALDRQRVVLRLAGVRSGRPGLDVVVGDGFALPFADDTFDVAMSSLTVHHFPDDRGTQFISELARVARRAVLVNDLERTALHYYGALALAATVWRDSYYARHDAPTSVRRAFRPSELAALGEAAGLRDVRVERHFPFRLALVGRPA